MRSVHQLFVEGKSVVTMVDPWKHLRSPQPFREKHEYGQNGRTVDYVECLDDRRGLKSVVLREFPDASYQAVTEIFSFLSI